MTNTDNKKSGSDQTAATKKAIDDAVAAALKQERKEVAENADDAVAAALEEIGPVHRVEFDLPNTHNGNGLVFKRNMVIEISDIDYHNFKDIKQPVSVGDEGETEMRSCFIDVEEKTALTHQIVGAGDDLMIVEV